MLKTISLTVLILYFIILLICVSKEKKNNNILDYFFGGRKIPFWQLSITFIASWWGAGSAISTADLAYEDGLGAFWYYGVPVLLATFIMILGAKSIRNVGYLTQGKMLEARYNKVVAKILSIMILIFMTFTAASQMVGIGDFFGTYLGINYELAIIVGTGIVLVYSLFGGFRGVVLTDIIQFVLLVISSIIVFVVAMKHSGGFSNIELVANQMDKPNFMNFFAGSKKYIMYIITFGCAWVIQANVWQRISATKDDKDAKKMAVMSFFVYIPLYLIVVFTGMAGIAIYKEMPQGGIITSIVLDYMNPMLGALVFVGISAAIMSTMDSLINTAAMTYVIDLSTEKDENKKFLLSRKSTFVITIVALLISLKIRSILDITWIASDIITTGVFIPLIGGFIWKKGNSKGATTSMICGLIYCGYNLLISLGINLPSFWKAQSTQQVILGVSISFISYVGVSLLSKENEVKAIEFIEKAKGI